MTKYAHKNEPFATWGAALVVIALFLAVIVFHALNSAIDTPTFHLDGAFQTASGLFRIGAGQVPGRDFYPYLGIGPLLLIYPFYAVAGGGLGASVFAAHFVTIALGALSVSVIWHLIFRPKSALYSACAGASVFALVLFFPSQYPVLNLFPFGMHPGNSLRPIRAVAPYLVSVLFLHICNRCQNRNRRNVLLGLLIGVTMLWSNDFAIPTAGIFSLVFCAYFYFHDEDSWKKSVLVFAATALMSWILLLSLITAGHPLELLRYNFMDVARDQWWFFAPYGPTTRVFGIGQLSRLVTVENDFALIVLGAVVLVALWTRQRHHALLAFIGLTLFLGGCLASVGGHIGGYFGAFSLWAATTTLLAVLQAGRMCLSRLAVCSETTRKGLHTGLLLAAGIGLLTGSVLKIRAYEDHLEAARSDAGRVYVEEFGGYVGAEWKDYIAYARANRYSKTIEDYWGVWSSLNGAFPPWPVDSVIHALGDVRQTARERLEKADIIISTRFATSSEWQPWNLSQNFWFYDELLSRWAPDFISPTSVIWRRVARPREHIDVACRISPERDKIILEPALAGYYRVMLDYRFSGGRRNLLLVKNNISFGGDAGGYVSISPTGSHTVIPVLIDQDSGNMFDSKVIGKGSHRLVIESCKAQKIAFRHADVLHLSSLEDFYITDGNWVRGIARRHTGFFVPNRAPFQEQYRVGRHVRMKNGDSRTITQVSPSGQYINVTVDGPLLQPEKTGFPTEFEVLETEDAPVAIPEGFFVTDRNWAAGVARAWPGFFVMNQPYYRNRFIPGKQVKFKNGSTRKITSVVISGNYLNVYVDGTILDPETAGIPYQYSVVEP